MAKIRNKSILSLVSFLILWGCGQQRTDDRTERSGQMQGEAISLYAIERSPAIEGAQVTLTSPQAGGVMEEGDSLVAFTLSNYTLGTKTETPRAPTIADSDEGQHVHIIIDNNPYFACYESPCSIGRLEPGPHILVAFPSRSYHESVKSNTAGQVFNFYVGEPTGEFLLDTQQPTLIYSRPKGTYAGKDARNILLDFYVHNVELSEDGYKARYSIASAGGTIDSEEENPALTLTLTAWQPAMVTGLPSGDYRVRLDLLDPEGNVVSGPLNSTSRTITVNLEGVASSSHAGGH